ncbi:MAG: tRNA(His) guanylyltransferase Thg1 family protein [Agitococcus sp.]|nr:tRNA(His) guanylyltransferase Thg1 family protein [Agitococcus sp.]MDO9179136.1 tRNA(His) guanylyltransferase Thg1 family protein [Agitococcus sp.]
MRKSDFNTMGDHQKSFENREAGRQLMPGLPALVRLDGRAFSTFTRGLARPYDEAMSKAMIETTRFLVDKFQATIGYTQSDEISLAFPSTDPRASMIYDGRIQKLCSILAASATAKFNQEVVLRMPDKAPLLPIFDARVWNVSSLAIAAEHFVWREADATSNSLNMAASAYYSEKELHKVGFAQKHDMLHAKGVNWNNYPSFFKRGSYVRRESIMAELSTEELSRIPRAFQPTGPVRRTRIQELDLPPLSKLANLQDVLFAYGVPEVMPIVT